MTEPTTSQEEAERIAPCTRADYGGLKDCLELGGPSPICGNCIKRPKISAALRTARIEWIEKTGEAALDDIYCDNCNSAIACASCARIHYRVIQAIRALKREE